MKDKYFHPFNFVVDEHSWPTKFDFLTNYQPRPVAVEASKYLQNYIQKQHLSEQKGKMYGVLVVQNQIGELGFLAAYSGQEKNHDSFFVPPLFNRLKQNEFFIENEKKLNALNAEIFTAENDADYLKIKNQLIDYQQQFASSIEEKKRANKLAKKQREIKRKELQLTNDQEGLSLLIRESQRQKSELHQLKKYWKEKIEHTQSLLQKHQLHIESLKNKRQTLSQQTQKQLFECYKCHNILGDVKDVFTIFREQLAQDPPAGTGDCCAPKLLNYAFKNQLTPVAMAEFWWGKSPKTEIRKHLHFYPACRGKCEPLLNHMLQGLVIDDDPIVREMTNGKRIELLFEDADILVINKPNGLLSVPGIKNQNSVFTQVQKICPNISGPVIVHRLDFATSGIMVLAKNKKVHQHLQNQFAKRKVFKRYVAKLDGVIDTKTGVIELPMRGDLLDRPRQMVCFKYGKTAVTNYEVVEVRNNQTRVYLYPKTGRTHQLRVHMAHPQGLDCAIVGDNLYGQKADRLYLHANQLKFVHPTTNEPMFFEITPDF